MSRRVLGACVAASGIALGLYLVLVPGRPTAALGRWCSDHYAHYGAAILFWHRGFDVFRRPVRELCPVVDRRTRAHAAALGVDPADVCNVPERGGKRPLVINWRAQPRPYPPGALLYALPEALLYAHTGLSFRTINQLTVAKHLVVGHLLVAVLLLLLLGEAAGEDRRAWTGAAFVLAPLVYFQVVPWAMGGIYDGVAVLAIVLGLKRAARGEPAVALLLVAAAMALHYRALWYLPLVPALALALVRSGRAVLRRPGTLACLAGALALGGLTAATFLMVAPSLGDFPHNNPLRFPRPGAGLVLRLDCWLPLALAVAVVVRERAWQLAVVLGWTAIVVAATVQVEPWHAMFLLPLLALVRVGRGSGRALGATLLAYLALAALVFGGLPLPGLFLDALLGGKL
jgi:hypothetical protein